MTSIFMAGTFAAAASGAVVTVSGATISTTNFQADSIAGVYFYGSGSFIGDTRQRKNATYTQINSGTDWLRPELDAPGDYRIRRQSTTGDTGFMTATITTSYDGIAATDSVYVTDTTAGFGGKSITFTIEIDDGTTLQDSGSYTCTADREDF